MGDAERAPDPLLSNRRGAGFESVRNRGACPDGNGGPQGDTSAVHGRLSGQCLRLVRAGYREACETDVES